MLTVEICEAKIEELQKRKSYIGKTPTQFEEEYCVHLERLLEAYEIEKGKALVRVPEEEEDEE